MENYYDEVIQDIKNAIEEGQLEEASYLLKKEFSMPYIPQDVEEKLKKLERDLVYAKSESKNEKTDLSTDKLLEMLQGSPVEQLYAANALSERNLRTCIEEIQTYLEGRCDPSSAALLINSLASQEIEDEFTYVKDGMEFTFWADAVIPVEKCEAVVSALELLSDALVHEPSILDLAVKILIHTAYMNLPLSYESDETTQLALDAIKEVSELMDDPEVYENAYQSIMHQDTSMMS